MRIFESFVMNSLVILLIGITNVCLGEKDDFDAQDLKALLGDLESLETEEQKSILRSLSVPEDVFIGEESRKSVLIRVDPKRKRNSEPYESKQKNDTDKSYEVHQWYATPSRTVEHHVEGGKLESTIDKHSKIINDKRDLKAQSTTYDEGYSHDSHEHYDDDHYHPGPDHHYKDSSGEEEDQNQYKSYHDPTDEGSSHDGPSSDVYFRKLKLKKVRKNCTRTKSKKSKGWPDTSDTIVHGRSNNVPEVSSYDSNIYPSSPEVSQYDSKVYHNVPEVTHYDSKSYDSDPAPPTSRYNDLPKFPSYPKLPEKALGFSGEHLHGIPRTHFFQYKDGEGINHFHLHNHHHIYTADGKKITLPDGPTYRNLINHFGKLKTILTSKDSESPNSYPQVTDRYRSTLNIGNLDPVPNLGNNKNLGYRYTGTHENYGRKAYKKIYPGNKAKSLSALDDDKKFGMEMFRYGAGQYGTDEFSNEEKVRYPNEVSSSDDKSYPYSGETFDPERNKPNYDTPSSLEYNSDSPSTPYKPYSGHYESNQNTGSKENIFNIKPEDKAPYTPQTHTGGTTSNDQNSGYFPPSSDVPLHHDPYPAPFSADDGKINPGGSPNDIPLEPPNIGHQGPVNHDVTHSVSYSQDGAIGSLNFGPENPSMFIRPEPDPLTIPRNAKVFEHHIRLHPMHYNLYSAMGRMPINYPAPFNNNLMYPVPLHKLMPNPLKMPLVPVAPPMYPNPLVNQMLRTYPARPLHLGANRWF